MKDMTSIQFTKAREGMNLTVDELAKATGISKRQIRNLGDPSGKFRIRKPIAMLMRLLLEADDYTLKRVGFFDD